MNINTRIWENSITDLPQGDPQAEQFEHYAREFFMPDSIAPSVYLANVAALMEQAAEENGVLPTPSAAKMALSMQHPNMVSGSLSGRCSLVHITGWFGPQNHRRRSDQKIGGIRGCNQPSRG